LTIHATIDRSITDSADSAAIQAEIATAVATFESLFTDPITVSIEFRYATTDADGVTPLAASTLGTSTVTAYAGSYGPFIAALSADATTGNDATALAHLPSPLAADIEFSSANGRAVGLNTPGALNADGTFGGGGTLDGIVTINAGVSFSFTRGSLAAGQFDGLQTIEHETDEVLGLASILPATTDFNGKSAVMPEDLFRYASPGVTSLTASPTAAPYFSIDGGTTDINRFNQNPNGDYGDWFSVGCPNPKPLVQLAFSCPEQISDVSATSPEGIALDVIGYDLQSGQSPTPTPTPPICAGDCAGSGTVSVSGLITLVNIVLGKAAASACPDGVPPGAQVNIALLLKAVNNALSGCPA
jgi:hypothetical protein